MIETYSYATSVTFVVSKGMQLCGRKREQLAYGGKRQLLPGFPT